MSYIHFVSIEIFCQKVNDLDLDRKVGRYTMIVSSSSQIDENIEIHLTKVLCDPNHVSSRRLFIVSLFNPLPLDI